MVRSPSNDSLPGLRRPQYETRSRYRKNSSNDCYGITACTQEVNREEIHLQSVKIKDLGTCLVPNSTNMPLGVQDSDNLQNIQKSAPFMRKNRDVNLQNIRKSPRLSVQNRGDKHVFESNQEGAKCRSNSQLEGLDQKKLCFPAEVILATSPQIDYQSRSVQHEREANLQNVRKSPRLSEEARERDMQLLFESNEKITNCRKKSRIKDLVQEKFISPAEVKLVKSPQIDYQSRSVEHERETNLQNVHKSPRLSEEARERDMQLLFESNEKITNCRKKSQIKDLVQEKFISPAEVKLVKSPQIDYQSRSVEHERETNLQNVRKSPRLSEEARGRDMQLLFESNEKIINCRKKSRIKDLVQEKFISPAEVKLVNMAKVHNESSNDEGKRDVQNTETLPRVSGKVPVIGLQGFVDLSSKGICTHESHIKSTFKSNLSLKTKAAQASIPHIPSTGVSYDRIISSQCIRNKSVRLSGKNAEMDLQKKHLSSEFSFATDVELTTVTHVQNKNSDCDQGMELKTMQKSLRLSCRSRETYLDSNTECSEEGRTEPQENSFNGNTLSAAKLFDKPQFQNISANSDGHVELKNMQKSPHLSGTKRQRELRIWSRKEVRLGAESQKKGRHENKLSSPGKVELTNATSAQNQTVKSNKEEINLGVKSQKKGFDGSTISPPIEVELTSAPSLHNEIVKADGCLLNKAIGSPLNSSESLPLFQYFVCSGKGINLVVDLNSSPSDWTKKIFSSSSQSLQKNKFESFRHEIESLRSKKMISSLVSSFNPFNKIIPSHLRNDACSQSVSGETSPLQSYVPERGDNGSSDITRTNSCIDVRTRDGHVENSSDVNTETSGDNIFSSQEYQETRITISETKASEQSSEKPVNTVPAGTRKRKKLGRKICGIRLKSGKHLGTRKSMRLFYQGGPR